ncbi:MAG: hypothetical protein KatS3mg090_0922 [Patescibacteria group bacterium]|nr:MAG: hypothetical protein KatS3mg090_0922 [Patescibacteria group bacterium]
MKKLPVIYIFYKRPDLVKETFPAIVKYRPEVLYLCQDGPKNKSEIPLIEKARDMVLNMITWDCKVVKIFREKNLGLMGHIPDSLNRFFKKYDFGIYIEEDIMVSDEFFKFQEEMYKKFKDDKKIAGITGFNPFGDKMNNLEHSYYLSQIGSVWGSGLFRRLWENYLLKPQNFREVILNLNKKKYFFSPKYSFYLEMYIDAIVSAKLKTWDFQINLSMIKNNLYFIYPKSNLVNNLGYFKDPTSAFISSYYKDFEKIFPLRHPKKLEYNPEYDRIYFDNLLKGGWVRLWLIKIYLNLPDKIKNIIKSFIVFIKNLEMK